MDGTPPSRDPQPPDSAVAPTRTDESPGFIALPPMRYQNAYVWFVLFSTLDVVLTWQILVRYGGSEINPIADLIIKHWGFMGAVMLKYALVLVVVIACELIARRREHTGRRLSWLAVAISLVPPIWSFMLLALHAAKGGIRP